LKPWAEFCGPFEAQNKVAPSKPGRLAYVGKPSRLTSSAALASEPYHPKGLVFALRSNTK
jgi:hypothetical protein